MVDASAGENGQNAREMRGIRTMPATRNSAERAEIAKKDRYVARSFFAREEARFFSGFKIGKLVNFYRSS
jgi:hypothetical protein